MQINRNEVESGWGWFGAGWKLFATNPGMWIAMILVLFVIYLGVSLVPFIGSLVISLIAPVLAGGLMYAAREVDSGRNLDLALLFRGFSEDGKLGPLMLLGVLSLALSIVSLVVLVFTLGGSFVAAAASAGIDLDSIDENSVEQILAHLTVSVPFLFGLTLFLAIVTAITMAMLYAPALVMLSGEEPVAALLASFRACMVNWLPLLVFGLLYIVFAIVAVIPFGLGLILLVPVTVCALYCSYRDIFSAMPETRAF